MLLRLNSFPLFLLTLFVLIFHTLAQSEYATLRVLHASIASQPITGIDLQVDDTIVPSIEYGMYTNFLPIAARRNIKIQFTKVAPQYQLEVELLPGRRYTVILFDLDTNPDRIHVSDFWEFFSSSDPPSGPNAIGILRDSEIGPPVEQGGLGMDQNIYRFVNLIPKSSFPEYVLDIGNPATIALIYKNEECRGCNYCVLSPRFHMAQLDYASDKFTPLDPSRDQFHPHSQTQISLVRAHALDSFRVALTVITPILSNYPPNDDELILYPCNFPRYTQRFMMKKKHLPIVAEQGDPLNPVNQEHHVNTLVFVAPQLPQNEDRIDVGQIQMLRTVEDEGRAIWNPFIAIILVFLGIYILLIFIIRTYQKHTFRNDDVSHFQVSNIQSSQNSTTPLLQPQPLHNSQQHQQQSNDASPKVNPQPLRLSSLDCFRGLIICMMVFSNTGGGGYSVLEHATWDGFQFADIIFPGFVWIMGVSNTLSTRQSKLIDTLVRSIKLFAIGLFLANVGKYQTFRVFGILQRFGIAYLAISFLNMLPKVHSRSISDENENVTTSLNGSEPLLDSQPSSIAAYSHLLQYSDYNRISLSRSTREHTAQSRKSSFVSLCIKKPLSTMRVEFSTYRYQWLVVVLITLLWAAVFLFIAAPDCPMGYDGPGGPFVHNGEFARVTANWSLSTCSGGINGYIDAIILGTHRYQTPTSQAIYNSSAYDPEGILGVLMTIVCAFFGTVIGRVLQHIAPSKLQQPQQQIHHSQNSPFNSQDFSLSQQQQQPQQQPQHQPQHQTPLRHIHISRIATWVFWSLLFFIITLLTARNGYPGGFSWYDRDDVENTQFLFPLWGINKNLWTIPFVTFATTVCTFSLALIYLLVDVLGSNHNANVISFASPLIFVGNNSLMLFILPNVCATKYPFTWVVYNETSHFEATLQSINAVIWVILIATYCYYSKIFWKV